MSPRKIQVLTTIKPVVYFWWAGWPKISGRAHYCLPVPVFHYSYETVHYKFN